MPPRFVRASIPRSREHWPDRSVGELFAETAARQPERVAVIEGGQRWSFAELASCVDELAHGLAGIGIGPDDVVAYQLPNWWEAVAVFLATARLGAIANPLLPSFREQELRFTLAQSGARVVFVPGLWRGCDHRQIIASLRAELPQLEHVIVCRDDCGQARPFAGLTAGGSSAQLPAPPAPEALLLLLYTSGTTAAPKGVLHTHATLGAEILSLRRVHGLGPQDRALMPSPVTHISGIIHAILTPALLGTSAVLMDRWEPRQALRLIAAERVTYMAGAPTFLQEMVQVSDATALDTSSLRLFSCGGASVAPDLVRRARALFPACVTKRVYGSSEFPTISTTGPDDAVTHGIDTEGRAIAPAEIRIVRDDGSPADDDEEGEVQARGPECFVGYADPSLDAETFTADGWFRSGDLGRLDDGGYLRITGRLKEVVIRKGEKISAREIEDILARHPAVIEAAVLAVPDAETGERACAVVVLRPGTALTLDDLRAFLQREGLARHKHPERLDVVTALPRTDSGKVARADLRARLPRE